MRIVVLGATGGMGARAADEIAALDIGEVVRSDRSAGIGVDLAVDVTDGSGLRRSLDRADIVVNCTGPFFRFGVPVLQAAIDTGTQYVDICDDPAPTIAMLALDDAARRAGVGAVIGMGASPGISNLLAVRAARHLDSVQDCFTVWPLDVPSPGQDGDTMDEGRAADGRPSAAAIHLMEQISGSIHVVEGGRLAQRQPLEPIALDYPGIGSGTAWTVGHPEPITLHRSLGVTGRAANAMLVQRATAPFLRRVGADIEAGRLTHEAAAEAVLAPSKERQLRALVGSLRSKGPGALPAFFVLLRGMQGGASRTVAGRLTSSPVGMAAATSIPAALAVAQLAERPAPGGVHPPEAVIDADRLLDALRPHCALRPASLDDLAPVSVA
jgi:lysine 6-dehydrogenase